MPTYDYECRKCGHTFEHFQNFSEPDLKRCPKCKGKLKRLIGMGAGIIFRGSGFYETDYRRSEYKKEAKKEADALEKMSGDASKKDTASEKEDHCKACCVSSDKKCPDD